MIVTPIYNGQGVGNQLHCYVTTRCIALDNGYDFGIQFPERFKGHSFMNLDMGLPVIGGRTDIEGQEPQELPEGITSYYREQGDGDYDPNIFTIPDNTMIHGNLQGEKYIEKHREKIKDWLAVEPLDMPDNLCVINIRGGEYKYVPAFNLPKAYYELGIAKMKEINPDMRFQIHTDDAPYAQAMFPEYEVISDIGLNWRSVRYAKYAIISNSSFGWLPAWLGDGYIIAPKYWGRYNEGYWFLKHNETKRFNYIHHLAL